MLTRKKKRTHYLENSHVILLDACKKLLLVISTLVASSVQITKHFITLNGSNCANIRSAWRSNQCKLTSSLNQYEVEDVTLVLFKELVPMLLSIMALRVYILWTCPSLQTAAFLLIPEFMQCSGWFSFGFV